MTPPESSVSEATIWSVTYSCPCKASAS